MTAEHWFIDENKSNGLMLALVAVPSTAVNICRAQMLRITKEPPRKRGGIIHFRKESDSVRERAFRQISTMPLRCIIIRVLPTVKPVSAREAAIRYVGTLANKEQPNRIVFELDEAALSNDRRWLTSALLVGSKVEFQHLGKSADAMLWIADGVAWAVHKGGSWRAMIEHLIVDEVRL